MFLFAPLKLKRLSLGGSTVLKAGFFELYALSALESEGFFAITSSLDSGFKINVLLQTFVFPLNKLIKTANTLNDSVLDIISRQLKLFHWVCVTHSFY